MGRYAPRMWAQPVSAQNGRTSPEVPLHWQAIEEGKQSCLDSLLPAVEVAAEAPSWSLLLESKQQLARQGYWGCSFDSIYQQDNAWQVDVYLGPLFDVRMDDSSLRRHASDTSGRVHDPKVLRRIMQEYVRHHNEHGHPHAEAWLTRDTPRRRNADMALRLHADAHERVLFDSIEVHGSSKLDPGFLRRRLGWPVGKPFSQDVLDEAEAMLRALPYAEVIAPPRLIFYREGAALRVYLRDRPTSYLNGVLGLVPAEASAQAQITGEVTLFLQSPLGKGIEGRLEWARPQPRSQTLQVNARYPYPAGWPIKLEGDFMLEKFDSSYLRLDAALTLAWQPRVHRSFLLSGNVQRSYGLQSPGQGDAAVQDLRLRLLGLGAEFGHIRMNGYSGFQGHRWKLMFWNGQKRYTRETREQTQAPEQQVAVFKLEGEGEYFHPLGQNSTLLGRIGARHWLDPTMAFNQQYRIGGAYSLRGIPERSLFTSSYGLSTQEYRLIFADGAYLQVFHDLAFYNQLDRIRQYRRRHGFGAGYNFAASVGLFSLQYAYGYIPQNPIDWRSGWLHFGFKGRF